MNSTGLIISLLVILVHAFVFVSTDSDLPKRDEKKAKGVTTFVTAKWESTPIVLELAEYLSGESSDLFWSFVDGVNSLKSPLQGLATDKEVYDACIGIASTLLVPAQLRMAKLALSMHLTSPAVRMFDEIATQNGAKDVQCEEYVHIASRKICDTDTLRDILIAHKQYDPEEHSLETYLLDHSYPSSDNKTLTAILYGELGTVEFANKHKILATYADMGAINYVVRWNVKPRGGPKLRLSGYGVELQLKSTEYKSQDDTTPKEADAGETAEPSVEEDENDPQNQIDGFNFGRLKNLFPALRTPLERFRRHLSESSEELAPLKVWQMQALSMQAAAAVVDANDAGGDEALKVLTSIAQNFPMQTKSLIHVNVPRSFRDEVLYNQDVWASSLGLRGAEPLLLVSGAQYDAEEVDVMALLAALREDVGPMNTLHALGLPKSLINKLMSLELGEAYTWEEYGLDIRDSAITWLNDLETDDRYRRWPSSFMELLRPTYPGMLRNLRRNIYNYLIVIDPTSTLSGPPLKLGETLLKHATPVRVGLVLAPGSDAALSAAVRSAFNYIAQDKNSNKEAFYFLTQLISSCENDQMTLEHVKKNLKKYASSGTNIDEIVYEDSEYNFGHQLAEEFLFKIASDKYPLVLINGVPLWDDGSPTPATSSVELLEEALVSALARHTARLQRSVFRSELSDTDDAVDYLMKQPHIMPRLNRQVLASEPTQYLDLSGVPSSPELFTEDRLHRLMHLTGRDALATALPILKYFLKSGKPEKITQTIWVVGDLNEKESRDLLRNAITFMRETGGVRVAFIPNVEGGSVDQSLNKVVLAALATLEPAKATKYVTTLLENEGCHEKQDCDILPELVPVLNKLEWVLKATRVLCARGMRLRVGARALVHNARIIGPFEDKLGFSMDDFLLLDRFSNQVYGDKIAEVLLKKKTTVENDVFDESITVDIPELSADEYLKVISVLASRSPKSRTPIPQGLRTEHSLVDLPPQYADEAAIEIVAVLDPASTAAQRLAPLLLVLRRVVNCRLKLFLNPQDKNSDMPLKSFYRYVLEPELQFTAGGALSGGALARFSRLPQAPLLSLELRTPPNWLVECVRSVYDLDNIRLADVDSLVHSEFELEYLLLEGHAWDTTLGTPPRGLQLILGSREQPELMDTIVMANLGYFQLKANPGAWTLRLRPGRSEDIYEIVGHENTEMTAGNSDIQVLLGSFRSHVVKLRVSKRAGSQHLDLLADNEDANAGGIWNSIASSFGGGGGEEAEGAEETINVFSVASGHLYERFLRIMMLSVLKHTKSPVKFWFLKNYLSPSLKDILPYMAQEYGFEYELVQYQWPRWLQRQRDRQRTIWGYKILFLDVLFPLHVKKIIFVDADQIVRADLKELVELDLGGAPYGYTPFCDSRKEMEGFRFWKQGYWRNHLQGRSYHISALYVVDLKRFRRIAAGDRLRGQYQALSQDPNSLSNLDQDLPNNMIHQVAIKSLPQEWLWCETWCDDNSKKYAKTIDLCNNPMTKEAKLSAAMRIVPEWREYDSEVRALQARVRRGLYQHTDTDQERHLHDAGKEHEHTEL